MDPRDDDSLDETALHAHGDAALEGVRFELARDGDHRLGQVVHVLALRASSTVVRTCNEFGARRGIGTGGIARAIEDAQTRVQLRLQRPEHLPAIDKLASGIARGCVEAQPVAAPSSPRLVPRAPELSIVKGLHEGTVRRNNPEMS